MSNTTAFENRAGLAKLIGLANLLFALILCMVLWLSHQQHIRHAQARAENTALTLERSLSGMIDQIDLLLIAANDELEGGLARGRINHVAASELLARLASRIPGLAVARYSDASGQVLANTGFPPKQLAVTAQDRDYFKELSTHPDSGMISTKPILGRTSDKWVILFALPYHAPDGAFAGVIYASIDLSRFTELFAAVKLGERSQIAMIDQDYASIAAYPMPNDPALLGQRMQQEAVIQQMQTGIKTLTTTITTKIDNTERIYAFRKLESRPYWVMAALSVEDELAPWRQQVGWAIFIMTIFAGLTGSAGWSLQRGWLQHKKMVSELKVSEQRFRDMVNTTDGIVWEADATTFQFTFISKKAEALLGYPADDWLSPGFWVDKLHPDDKSWAPEYCASCTGRLEPHDFEYRFITKDGRTVWLHDIVTVVGENGKPRWLRGLMIDITERKKSDAELEKHRQHLEVLVQERTEELDAANRDLRRNDQRLSAMLAMSQKAHELDERELIQMGIDEAVRLTGSAVGYIHFINDDQESIELKTWSEETSRHCTAAYDDHYPLSAAGIWADTARLRRPVIHNDYQSVPDRKGYPEGHFHLVRHLGAPVIDDGKVRILMGVGNKAEDYNASDVNQIQLIGNDLWSILMRRRVELALSAASKKAEAASIAKSAFLANMSHEIRTPMNGIVGMANILRQEGVTPKQAQRLDTIDTSARHLLSVINNILDLSKIEAGKFELEEAPVVIGSLLANVSSILSERARAKGIHLLIETAPLPTNLVGDPVRLQQALLNYATNAVTFTDAGSVTLRAIMQEEAADSARLRFEVQDMGIGIAQEALSRLFNAFEQADNSMTRKYGGTGLGLAITRRLAELMGGEAGAESTPGVGSTFWFTVTLKKGEDAPVTQAAVDAKAALQHYYSALSVLVVDDEPINREIAQLNLEAAGLRADTAEDGAEAVKMAQQGNYSVILMDMQMPKLNGLEATRQIRQLPAYRQTPIIAMTANAFAEDKAACLEAGMNGFLAKPFNPDELFSILLGCLKQQKS